MYLPVHIRISDDHIVLRQEYGFILSLMYLISCFQYAGEKDERKREENRQVIERCRLKRRGRRAITMLGKSDGRM